MSIGFVGAGNMASAIIKGYIGNAKTDIWVYDIDEKKMDVLAELGVKKASSLKVLVSQVKYLVLAVKPQNFTEVLEDIKGNISPDTVVISIAAGITAEYIKKSLGFDAKVVLVMPNTPLLLGCGATALSKAEPTAEEEFRFVCEMFESSGKIAVISPDKMNEIIAVNGSSPAFIYQITKHFVDYAAEQGIDGKVALELFCQALVGSAKMMTDSGYDLDTLIQMVSSKGGTTIAGLEAMAQNGLGEALRAGCDACTKRAYELAK